MVKPLVSVNLTTFNRSHYLGRCIDSVFAQSYPNIELIIVDDASIDDTEKVVSHYQNKYLDKKIKYIKHKVNLKLSKTRNTAWQNSTGDLIATLDDDDVWIDRDKISKQVDAILKSEQFAIVCTSVRIYTDQNIWRDKLIKNPRDLQSRILKGNGLIYTSTALIRKCVLSELGGFDEKMLKGVDSEFYRRCIVKYGYGVHFMSDVTTAVHEYGADRMTTDESRRKLAGAINSNLHVIKIYFSHLLLHPDALVVRVRRLVKTIFKYVITH